MVSFAVDNGAQAGPYPMRSIIESIRLGQRDPGTLVWWAGEGDWVPFNSVDSLMELLQGLPADDQPPPPGDDAEAIPLGEASADDGDIDVESAVESVEDVVEPDLEVADPVASDEPLAEMANVDADAVGTVSVDSGLLVDGGVGDAAGSATDAASEVLDDGWVDHSSTAESLTDAAPDMAETASDASNRWGAAAAEVEDDVAATADEADGAGISGLFGVGAAGAAAAGAAVVGSSMPDAVVDPIQPAIAEPIIDDVATFPAAPAPIAQPEISEESPLDSVGARIEALTAEPGGDEVTGIDSASPEVIIEAEPDPESAPQPDPEPDLEPAAESVDLFGSMVAATRASWGDLDWGARLGSPILGSGISALVADGATLLDVHTAGDGHVAVFGTQAGTHQMMSVTPVPGEDGAVELSRVSFAAGPTNAAPTEGPSQPGDIHVVAHGDHAAAAVDLIWDVSDYSDGSMVGDAVRTVIAALEQHRDL